MKVKKKLVESVHEIEFGVFADYRVRLVFTSSIKESVKRRDLDKDTGDMDRAGAITFDTVDGEAGGSTIFYPRRPTNGFIVHETYHAVVDLANYIGFDDEETMAYLIQYIVENTIKIVRGLK
jgi:hypothetical protein